MSCKHCGEKCESDFCCKGCEVAHSVINGLNLSKYYEYCKSIYNQPPKKVVSITNRLKYDDYIKYDSSEDQYSVDLLVEGIHCGSCIWLIESTLKDKGVVSARINLSTNRINLIWKGNAQRIQEFVDIVEKIGYKLLPYNIDIKIQNDELNLKDLVRRIFIAGFGSIAMMMIVWGVWFGEMDSSMGEQMKRALNLVATIFAVPCIIYSSVPFIRSAWGALRVAKTNMDVPISLAIILTTIISIQQAFLGSDQVYYEAATSLVFFLLIGRYLDAKVRNKARNKATEILMSQVQSVTVMIDDRFELIDVRHAQPGQIAYINAGEKIPIDGVIIDGETEVDNRLITGENMPEWVAEGGKVFAGTINLRAPIKVRITSTSENTTLSEIIRLMEKAEQSKSAYVSISDFVAKIYTYVVIILSSATFIAWLSMGASYHDAILYAVSVLIITCPCALGLAVPAAQIAANSRLLNSGIIMRTADGLEKISQIEKIYFDKTGTLTSPDFVLKTKISDEDAKLIASIAAKSSHPLSKALAKIYSGKILDIDVKETRGHGLTARYKNELYMLGKPDFCGGELTKSPNIQVCFNKAGKVITLELIESLKSDAKAIVKKLRKYELEIISGDRKEPTELVAKELGIKRYRYRITPIDKYQIIHNERRKVLMIGDGLNDSAALKEAFASISPCSALEIAQAASDFVIQGEKLAPVLEILSTAKKFVLVVKQNFLMSLFYNLYFVVYAVMGNATPILAAIAMSSSSILVILNSLRVRK